MSFAPHRFYGFPDTDTHGDTCSKCGLREADPVHVEDAPRPPIGWARLFSKANMWKVWR